MSTLPSVQQTGMTGMLAAKAGIATAGHNIANANTEGYSRERAIVTAEMSQQMAAQGGPYVGRGAKLAKVERINDEYLEKQIRESARDVAHYEEKQGALHQVEDIFNEMNGDGLNRLMARFFNEFRKLSNDPSSEAIRQSVREASKALASDFKRLHSELVSVQNHLDSRIEGGMKELNELGMELKDLNIRIHASEITGHTPNDLADRRDVILRKMMTYFDLSAHKDEQGMVTVDVKGVGPLVSGPNVEQYSFARSPADASTGKPENALQITRSSFSHDDISNQFKGGKLGALIETRNKTVSSIINRLDEMAYGLANSVNEIHERGATENGQSGIPFFKPIDQVARASELISLSDQVNDSASNIATALNPNHPGDNRLALAISNLQNARLLNGGKVNFDDYYNSIVSDVGVASQRNNEALNQEKTILGQMDKMRDQISGVSVDEETTKLMQYQHAFNASARVINSANEMLDTIMNLVKG